MLTVNQLYLMMSCRKNGISAELLPHFLLRCSLTDSQFVELIRDGILETKKGRLVLTKAGERMYKIEHAKGYF